MKTHHLSFVMAKYLLFMTSPLFAQNYKVTACQDLKDEKQLCTIAGKIGAVGDQVSLYHHHHWAGMGRIISYKNTETLVRIDESFQKIQPNFLVTLDSSLENASLEWRYAYSRAKDYE